MGLLESEGLAALMDVAGRNHAVIANNLANLNTPGYKTARLDFAKRLDDLLDKRGNLLPGRRIETKMHRPDYADAGLDGNDVSLAREIGQLNKNMVKMRLYLAVLSSRIRRLRAAISGR